MTNPDDPGREENQSQDDDPYDPTSDPVDASDPLAPDSSGTGGAQGSPDIQVPAPDLEHSLPSSPDPYSQTQPSSPDPFSQTQPSSPDPYSQTQPIPSDPYSQPDVRSDGQPDAFSPGAPPEPSPGFDAYVTQLAASDNPQPGTGNTSVPRSPGGEPLQSIGNGLYRDSAGNIYIIGPDGPGILITGVPPKAASGPNQGSPDYNYGSELNEKLDSLFGPASPTRSPESTTPPTAPQPSKPPQPQPTDSSSSSKPGQGLLSSGGEQSGVDRAGPLLGLSAVPSAPMWPEAPLLRRFYPFLRPLTAGEAADASARGGAVHLTPAGNLPGIETSPGQVRLRPSVGYRSLGLVGSMFVNLSDPGLRQSAYLFAGPPSPTQVKTNLAGRGDTFGTVQVSGSDLPPGTMIRPLDGVIAIPGGYTGPGRTILPGEPLPPIPDVRPPSWAPPSTLLEAVQRNGGGFSGHPVGAGVGSGLFGLGTAAALGLYHSGHLPPTLELGRSGSLSAAGGAAGSLAERAFAQGFAKGLNAAGSGLGRQVLQVRVGAGGAGGIVGAVVVEVGGMLTDDKQHSSTDYEARLGRAAADGFLSGLASAAVSGALAGSVAPGPGNLVGLAVGATGFVVGVGVYIAADWLFGDTIEQGIRHTVE